MKRNLKEKKTHRLMPKILKLPKFFKIRQAQNSMNKILVTLQKPQMEKSGILKLLHGMLMACVLGSRREGWITWNMKILIFFACKKQNVQNLNFLKKLWYQVMQVFFRTEMYQEGRLIIAEYNTFYVVNVYVPNSGRKLVTLDKRLKWNPKFQELIKDLDSKKPVIICGDMNVAHQEIDIAHPKSNKRNAGFTQEERDGFSELLKSAALTDCFRQKHPDVKGAYTFWTYMANARKKNIGWRLDYCLLSKKLMANFCDCCIRSEVYGSDHCPVVSFLHL
ncbi:hypothetical protein OUZ56_008698 [Daphnia magna]|uniref:exodeoxyribonuclease III n=1 Tax=Daphnia magna TaxID=35525 RepID=A0ABR0ADT3_9CRUS|nr:hypothetical protein OUZ56_008698 [Daphnia magna]